MQSEPQNEPDYSKVGDALAKLHAAFTELKSLASPPQAVIDISQGVLVFVNYPTGNWAIVKKSYANINSLWQALKGIKSKIDRGDDFSQAIEYTDKLLKEPAHSYEAIRKISAAAAMVQVYL